MKLLFTIILLFVIPHFQEQVITKEYFYGDVSGVINLTYLDTQLISVEDSYGAYEYYFYNEKYFLEDGEVSRGFFYHREQLLNERKSVISQKHLKKSNGQFILLFKTDTIESTYNNIQLDYIPFDTLYCNNDSILQQVKSDVKRIIYRSKSKANLSYIYKGIFKMKYSNCYEIELITLDSIKDVITTTEIEDKLIMQMIDRSISIGDTIHIKWEEVLDEEGFPLKLYIPEKTK